MKHSAFPLLLVATLVTATLSACDKAPVAEKSPAPAVQPAKHTDATVPTIAVNGWTGDEAR